LSYVTDAYRSFRLYRVWSFGRTSPLCSPQPADLPTDHVEEDFSNLGLVLNHIEGMSQARNVLLEHLKSLYPELTDFYVQVKGGTVLAFLKEGNFTIPASRLSDGTLRYLCLLAILCDPEPPPLICIEEPELGLHPDLLPKLADLMVEASERTQLIVTTHSDILVDAMTDRPEVVMVVEKHKGQTTTRRLDANELKIWLEKYRLGELWTRGQIGGTRW
jgi:predicted ATPase